MCLIHEYNVWIKDSIQSESRFQQQCLLSADQRLAFPSDKVISCFCFRRRATYRTVLLTEWTYLRFLQSDYRI